MAKSHIINGFDVDTYKDGDNCTKVFDIQVGEYPASQALQVSDLSARAFLHAVLHRTCTPLEGSPGNEICFMDDATGLGFTLCFETGKASKWDTVVVSDVRVLRSSSFDGDGTCDKCDSACRNDVASLTHAEWRDKVLNTLIDLDVYKLEGDSHAWLSAVCEAIYKPETGWTKGACSLLINDLIDLICGREGDEDDGNTIARLTRRHKFMLRRMHDLQDENSLYRNKVDAAHARADRIQKLAEQKAEDCARLAKLLAEKDETIAELQKKLSHRQMLAERNGSDALDAERENKSLRRRIRAYEETVSGLVKLINYQKDK